MSLKYYIKSAKFKQVSGFWVLLKKRNVPSRSIAGSLVRQIGLGLVAQLQLML